MKTGALIAYHGTDGDTVLAIVRSGALRPNRGLICLGSSAEQTYVHGVDVRRRASFSFELLVELRDAIIRRTATPGNPITIQVYTDHDLPIVVRRLHVRRPKLEGGFLVESVSAVSIERYLEESP